MYCSPTKEQFRVFFKDGTFVTVHGRCVIDAVAKSLGTFSGRVEDISHYQHCECGKPISGNLEYPTTVYNTLKLKTITKCNRLMVTTKGN